MLYIILITFGVLFIELMTVCASLFCHTFSLLYAIIAPLFILAYVLILCGILALSLRFLIPKKFLNYNNKLFRTRKKELKSLENLGIKQWKDRIPELGWTAGFSKKKLKSLDSTYLLKFLEETCFAEFFHALTAILSFTVVFFFPIRDFFFVLPMLVLNATLHVLPCLIQRYNRYRLDVAYRFSTRNLSNDSPDETFEDDMEEKTC